eukprot:COSAG01_NODE_5794_length_4032_cov_7.346809_3_plen_95_part_00
MEKGWYVAADHRAAFRSDNLTYQCERRWEAADGYVVDIADGLIVSSKREVRLSPVNEPPQETVNATGSRMPDYDDVWKYSFGNVSAIASCDCKV